MPLTVTLTEYCQNRAQQTDGGQYAIAAALFELVNLIKSEIDKNENALKAAEAEGEQIKKNLEVLMERGRPNE